MKLFIAKCADVRVDIMIMNEIFVYRSRAVGAIHLNKFAVKFAIKTDNEEIKGLYLYPLFHTVFFVSFGSLRYIYKRIDTIVRGGR